MVIDESIGTFPLNHNSLKAYCQLKSCYKMIKKLVLLFMNYNFRFFMWVYHFLTVFIFIQFFKFR